MKNINAYYIGLLYSIHTCLCVFFHGLVLIQFTPSSISIFTDQYSGTCILRLADAAYDQQSERTLCAPVREFP